MPPRPPYRRPAVALTGSVSRVWHDRVSVMSLSVGDLIADQGAITEIDCLPDGYVFTFASGQSEKYLVRDEVRAAVPR